MPGREYPENRAKNRKKGCLGNRRVQGGFSLGQISLPGGKEEFQKYRYCLIKKLVIGKKWETGTGQNGNDNKKNRKNNKNQLT